MFPFLVYFFVSRILQKSLIKQIFTKLGRKVAHGPRKRQFDFGAAYVIFIVHKLFGWLSLSCVIFNYENLTAIHTRIRVGQERRSRSFYAALLPRRGPHIASHSVCLSVCLSVRPVIVSVTSRHLANYNDTHVLFGTHRGPHIVRPSRPHKLVLNAWK